jgi:hypothetical protein
MGIPTTFFSLNECEQQQQKSTSKREVLFKYLLLLLLLGLPDTEYLSNVHKVFHKLG